MKYNVSDTQGHNKEGIMFILIEGTINQQLFTLIKLSQWVGEKEAEELCIQINALHGHILELHWLHDISNVLAQQILLMLLVWAVLVTQGFLSCPQVSGCLYGYVLFLSLRFPQQLKANVDFLWPCLFFIKNTYQSIVPLMAIAEYVNIGWHPKHCLIAEASFLYNIT